MAQRLAERRTSAILLGFSRSPQGHYEGWYAPTRSGTWTLRIELTAHEAQSLTHAEVNDAKIAIKRPLDGAIELTGTGDTRNPLRWSLR